MSTRIHIGASRVHKWLALIIGGQLLLWTASGLVMSILPIADVRGEHLVSRETVPVGNLETLVAPAHIAKLYDGQPVAINYRMLLDRPVVHVVESTGRSRLFDGYSGVERGPVTESEARKIALMVWRGKPADFSVVKKMSGNSIEYQGVVPAWQVENGAGVRIFIPVETGQIAAVRSPTWRFYDFFWALHIMDWKNHENFNSWWLVTFAASALLMAVSGLILLVKRWPARKFFARFR